MGIQLHPNQWGAPERLERRSGTPGATIVVRTFAPKRNREYLTQAGERRIAHLWQRRRSTPPLSRTHELPTEMAWTLPPRRAWSGCSRFQAEAHRTPVLAVMRACERACVSASVRASIIGERSGRMLCAYAHVTFRIAQSTLASIPWGPTRCLCAPSESGRYRSVAIACRIRIVRKMGLVRMRAGLSMCPVQVGQKGLVRPVL
jgi:hypothetical protein